MVTAVLLSLAFAFSGVAPAAQEENSPERRMATQLARQMVLAFLADNEEIEIDFDRAEGKVKPIDPQENLKLELDHLVVGDGTGVATVKLQLPAGFDLEVKPNEGDSETVSITGEADLQLELRFVAEFRQEDNQLRLRAQIEELKCEAGEIRDLEPEDLRRPKELFEALFGEYGDRLRRQINDWLDEKSTY